MKKLRFTYTSWSNISHRIVEEYDLDEWDLEEIEEEGGVENWLMVRDWPHDMAKEFILNDISYDIEVVDE